jgi:hypothetical protein
MRLVALPLLLSLAAFQKPQPPSADEEVRRLANARQFTQALAAYDRYVAAHSHRPDAALLGVIARAQLQELAKSGDAVVAASALERLARSGDTAATTRLREAAAGAGDLSREATAALLRLGDKDTVAHATTVLDAAPPEQRAALIQTLGRNDARAAGPAIVKYLGDPAPNVRAIAAQALGLLGVREAIPQLQAMFNGDTMAVKPFAAVALKKLGQSSADTFIASMLASEVPEGRLNAANAYSAAESKLWLEPVRQLRSTPNEPLRVRVAERLACCDAATARTILLEALASPVPVLRADAARVLEESSLADLNDARRLMGDAYPNVQLRGDGIALHPPAKPPQRGRGR